MTKELTKDEAFLLEIFNKMVVEGHGEMRVCVRDSVVVRIEKTDKYDREKYLQEPART